MYDFSYHNPDSVADAVSAMNKAEDGKFVAGGQTMLPSSACTRYIAKRPELSNHPR